MRQPIVKLKLGNIHCLCVCHCNIVESNSVTINSTFFSMSFSLNSLMFIVCFVATINHSLRCQVNAVAHRVQTERVSLTMRVAIIFCHRNTYKHEMNPFHFRHRSIVWRVACVVQQMMRNNFTFHFRFCFLKRRDVSLIKLWLRK